MRLNKPKFSFLLKILVSLSLLALLVWLARENFAEIRQRLSFVNIFFFALAFLLFISGVLFLSWRLKIVLAAQGGLFSIRDVFSLSLIGYFFTNFMPTSFGGDLVKGYLISQKIKSKISSYTSIFVDRLIGLFSLILIATIAALIMRKEIEHRFIIWVVGLLFLFCIIFILFLFNKGLLKKIVSSSGLARLLRLLKLDSSVKKAYEAMNIYADHKRKILQAFILSLTAQFFGFFAVYLLSISLKADILIGEVFLIMPIIGVLCTLPITMGGLGLREGAFVFFFSPKMGDAVALSVALLYLALYLLNSLIGGIVYIFWR